MASNRRVFVVSPNGRTWRLYEEGDASDRGQEFDRKDDAIEAGKKSAQGFGPAVLRIESEPGVVELEQVFDKDPLVTQLEKFGF